jgi:L-2-hydroxyglutarate oxidase LhgO
VRLECDVVVVGGGVIGLACAAALAGAGRSVVLCERGAGFGRETSARNSEVIHAGLYDPVDSLKASLCVRGRMLLYERCVALKIPHRKTGKLVVATRREERAALDALEVRGQANGVSGVRRVSAQQLSRLEPEVRGLEALLSAESGIVDTHRLCESFAAEAASRGAQLLLHSDVVEIEALARGYRVAAITGGERSAATCAAVVNAAGLGSDSIAELAGLDLDTRGLRLHLCKGDYFGLAPGRKLSLSHLVYPVPPGLGAEPGLGIHATPDLAGRIRFGPDAEYVETVRYDVAPAKAQRFAAALSRFLPEIEAGWLIPEGAGIRPRLAGPGESFRDFVVAEASSAGLPGFVNLIGIESPGLTAAPAIAERVVALLGSF